MSDQRKNQIKHKMNRNNHDIYIDGFVSLGFHEEAEVNGEIRKVVKQLKEKYGLRFDE